ncbi:13577_t:CDS:2 [Acaulospora morrowiae]|uniref:13577_t:CDS:1 n=1 Tax=Acaulospora morrowiae TaxID=94023 RepID=A0A9N9AVJ9_9GLOM|nr:13577_t:CDS:2 [Acaulospora morrowiae]
MYFISILYVAGVQNSNNCEYDPFAIYPFAENMENSVIVDFADLLENHDDYNVKIIVGKGPNVKEFKAHKYILTSRSTYFKSALSSRWARLENGITIFNKPNISPSVFEVLLKYIYTGAISVGNNVSLVDIVIASDELQLLEVYRRLERCLLEDESAWNPRDVITILQHNNFVKLYNTAIKLACKNPEATFNSEDFIRMKETHLINLLKYDELELDEIKIWEYLIHWGIENTNFILDYDSTKWTPENFLDLKNTLRNCISYIRFFQMSPSDYVKVRAHFKDILPDGLDDEVIQYFLDPNFRPSTKILPSRKYPFESNIINAKDAGLIASWIVKRKTPYPFRNIPLKFKLIYRASSEGFGIESFHRNCDNKGPTLVVIKVRNSGEIIGGYNPLEWRGVKEKFSLLLDDDDFDHQCETSNSFIFSLTNRAIPILSRVSSKKEAIIWCRSKGPCFGLHDLLIKRKLSIYAANVEENV